MNAHRANASRDLILKEIFGKVEYFIIHKYDEYKENNYGQIYSNKFGSFQFIEVIGIDRCVGFFKIENLFYILDRERI